MGFFFPVSYENYFWNALSADRSRDPSGPVGPDEEGSPDSQPKRPHGAPKPPGEQVGRTLCQIFFLANTNTL